MEEINNEINNIMNKNEINADTETLNSNENKIPEQKEIKKKPIPPTILANKKKYEESHKLKPKPKPKSENPEKLMESQSGYTRINIAGRYKYMPSTNKLENPQLVQPNDNVQEKIPLKPSLPNKYTNIIESKIKNDIAKKAKSLSELKKINELNKVKINRNKKTISMNEIRELKYEQQRERSKPIIKKESEIDKIKSNKNMTSLSKAIAIRNLTKNRK